MSVRRLDYDEYETDNLVWSDDGPFVNYDDYAALEARCAGLKDELERERVRLAACGVAAMGYEDKGPLDPGSYGYSASYDDVLRFRKQLIAERDALQAKLAAAEEALKPSAETKAEYMGEFSWKEESLDEYEEPCLRTIYVPWTTIKEIMKAIKARAALADTTTDEVQP